jgi:hypothetical protein
VRVETRGTCDKQNRHFLLKQACSAFYVVLAASAKLGLHAGNIKFDKNNVEYSVHRSLNATVAQSIIAIWS